MYQNSIYGIFNQNYVQTQLQMLYEQQYHVTQQRKAVECANKLDDFLKCAGGISTEYQNMALYECCLVIIKHMSPQGNFIPQV